MITEKHFLLSPSFIPTNKMKKNKISAINLTVGHGLEFPLHELNYPQIQLIFTSVPREWKRIQPCLAWGTSSCRKGPVGQAEAPWRGSAQISSLGSQRDTALLSKLRFQLGQTHQSSCNPSGSPEPAQHKEGNIKQLPPEHWQSHPAHIASSLA